MYPASQSETFNKALLFLNTETQNATCPGIVLPWVKISLFGDEYAYLSPKQPPSSQAFPLCWKYNIKSSVLTSEGLLPIGVLLLEKDLPSQHLNLCDPAPQHDPCLSPFWWSKTRNMPVLTQFALQTPAHYSWGWTCLSEFECGYFRQHCNPVAMPPLFS